jgi:transposase
LRCFRGIDTLTAILILAELHDFRRFHSARALMAYLGLVPGEDSTGEKHRRGRITRTGNALVRRLLIETAWHYQHRPGVGVALTRRRKGQPGRVIAIADKAQQRLCRRFRRLAEQHKPASNQDRRRDRARVGGLLVGSAPTDPGIGRSWHDAHATSSRVK